MPIAQAKQIFEHAGCGPTLCRAHTLCFWAIFLVFIIAIGYLGILAFTEAR